MATSSTSTSQSIVNTGGTFAQATNGTLFRDQDYGEQALSTPSQLRQFFQQLNPLIGQLNQLSTASSINNLDGLIVSSTVSILSDWTGLTLATGATLNGNTLLTSLNAQAGNAVRKDGWGNVWLAVNVSAANANMYTLAQPYWPPCTITQGSINITNAGVVTSTAAQQGIISWPSASLSPGTVPGFPVYLQVAQSRTPAAVFLMGAKPTTNQSLYQQSTGGLVGPLTCSWNWLSGTAPQFTGTAQASQVNTVRINGVWGLNSALAPAPTGLSYVLSFLILYSYPGQSSGA